MRKLNFIPLVLISVLFILGCYESEVPLSKPSSKIDQRLIGNWVKIEGKYEKSILLLFRKFNDNEYFIAWKEGDDKTQIAGGFNTKISDTNIINVHGVESLETKERTYVFCKYDFTEKGSLVIDILSSDYPELKGKKFKTSKDFEKFIRKNISQKGLFEESIEFRAIENINLEINPQ